MNSEEVRKKREEIEYRIRELEGEIDIEKARIKALQRLCQHPNKYRSTSYDGSSDMICPDCGKYT